MARQTTVSVDNTFVKGLITEATGLNFPDHAWISGDNCIPSILGNVKRRPGLNLETNRVFQEDINRTGKAISSYVWKNASGDGLTQIFVLQIGDALTFYKSSAATLAAPLSNARLGTTVALGTYKALGSLANINLSECQYSDGNGYLFIFHPDLEPIYCSYSNNIITASTITVKIRDFLGTPEGVGVPTNYRPSVLSIPHQYNLNNQGWTSGAGWGSNCTTAVPATLGSHVFVIDAGLPVVIGQQVAMADPSAYLAGTVTAYSGTNLTVNVFSTSNPGAFLGNSGTGIYSVASLNTSLIDTFKSALGIYPSNADIWWTFKNTSSVFAPATTAANVTLSIGNAPKGHFVLDAFRQLRAAVSSIPGLDDIVTVNRPRTGTWFQGRVWYSGVDASQAAVGTAPNYTWTESIYFSQIITSSQELGLCYQNNDPTSESFADLLPSDGGVIQIQGCGSIYKLFPVQNGLLVFAANGIKFITGSTGIGFTANDYTIVDLSDIHTVSGTSFVNVQGYPMFWNEEGIYYVSPDQNGKLSVNNLCLGTILTEYASIPPVSKKAARGDYNPLDYIISWLYRDANEIDLASRYDYNRILNYNTATKAFYTDTIGTIGTAIYVNDVKYVPGLGDGVAADSNLKYVTSANLFKFTFSEFIDTTNWVDFNSWDGTGVNFVSTFTTGYKLKGSALTRWQPTYVGVYTNNPSAYTIQGIWDYATSGNAGRFSSQDLALNYDTNTSVSYRRHKIRGHGKSLQLRYTSVDGQSFDIIGWAILESTNANV